MKYTPETRLLQVDPSELLNISHNSCGVGILPAFDRLFGRGLFKFRRHKLSQIGDTG
jgi:hypothetical protein